MGAVDRGGRWGRARYVGAVDKRGSAGTDWPRPAHQDMEETKRILLRVPNWVGDAVMTLPALEALKGLYPGSGITVLARETVLPVYESNPAVTDLIEYGEEFRSIGGRIRLSKRIGERGFDLAVLFQNAFDAAFLAFMARIPRRVGYGRDMRSCLLTRAIPCTKAVRRLHHIEYYLNIINALGPVEVGPGARPMLYIREDEAGWAEDFLRKEGMAPGLPIIGAAPGAAYGPAKRWAEERFSQVLDRLSGELGAGILIFGGPGDRGPAGKVCEGLKERVSPLLDLAGRTTLRQSMALMRGLRVFITNDSGAMHVAAALGTPTVAVFGSTDPALTGPRGENTRVVMRRTECSPCFDRECRYGHRECLEGVSVEDVLGAAEELMRKCR